MILSKEEFVEIINNIKKQDKKDDDFSKAIGIMCDGSPALFGVDNKITESLLSLLIKIFEDKDDWISWWIYERVNDEYKAYYKNKKEIKLNTAEDLYNFLIKNMKKNLDKHTVK